ncbi:MAG: cobalamin-dependent protein [Candidatus Omnitrophica bacterium]|nr:cobalamin-dependent protein [Candidatus Omnitrophota bacterium]MDD5591909.1 cobalamin-dependent protein [Candidatus Omnitrophota bacterium]
MKILFIHNMSENLGIEYLSSFLKAKGHEVRLSFDPWLMKADIFEAISAMNKKADRLINRLHQKSSEIIKRKILENIKSYQPDVIGFSLYTNNLLWAIDMAKNIKNISSADIVCGGPHATTAVERVLSNECFDYAIVGEGEYALSEFLDCKSNGLSFDNISNLAFKKNGNIITNRVREYIYNLDVLPFPDKNLFYEKVPQLKECYLVMTSRGCPFRCSYCINDAVQSRYEGVVRHIRLRSVENVISELRNLKNDKNIKAVFFEDDVFTLDKKRLEELMYRYKREVNIPFWCFVHPRTITQQVARVLKYGGCWMGNMGMQSGSERIRSVVMGRNETNQDILNASGYLKAEGIKLSLDVILGAPKETIEDLEKTSDILTAIKPDRLNTYWITYYPRTSIINIALKDGNIDSKFVEGIEEGKLPVRMSDGGSVLTNKDTYKYYELLYTMLAFFKTSRKGKLSIIKKTAKMLPCKSYFKRFFELLITLRNRDFKFFYLIRYVLSAKTIP